MDKPDWFLQHENSDVKHFSAIEGSLKEIKDKQRTDAELKELFKETLFEFFERTGKITKTVVYGAATIVVGLGIITGGFKWILALFGFSILKQ